MVCACARVPLPKKTKRVRTSYHGAARGSTPCHFFNDILLCRPCVFDASVTQDPVPAKMLSVDLSKTGNVATANTPAKLSVAQVGGGAATHTVVLGNVSPRAADPCGIDSVKKRVAEMVGDKVYVSAQKLVRMDDVCANIERWNAGDKSWDEERVTAAMAGIMKDSVNEMPVQTKETYPEFDPDPNVQLAEVPGPLARLLSMVMFNVAVPKDLPEKKKMKVSYIGQMVRAFATNRLEGYIPPLPFFTTVHLHAKYASRHLTDTLHALGIGLGRAHLGNYGRAAAVASKKTLPTGASAQGAHAKMSADNADFARSTLTGLGSWHQMGMLLMMIGVSFENVVLGLPRATVKPADVLSFDGGKLEKTYYGSKKFPTSRTYAALPTSAAHAVYPGSQDSFGAAAEALLRLSPAAGDKDVLHSEWMKHVHKSSEHSDPCSTYFPNMIDLNPGSAQDGFSSVVSAMLHARDLYKDMDVNVYQMCFDLPLYMKALVIVAWAKELKPNGDQNHPDLAKFIPTLGGFHTLMSFLGGIGYTMKNSGLSNGLEEVFGPLVVESMMGGHAYARAIRGHELASMSFHQLIIADAEAAGKISADDKEVIMIHYSALVGPDPVAARAALTAAARERVVAIDGKVLAHRETTRARGPTAALFVQYVEMVEVAQRFLRAERTGDFKLHCRALREMLPHMASTGRNHYVKALTLYLDMIDEADPVTLAVLTKFHAVRRTQNHWSMVSDDHAIEMELMRALKVGGGLFETNASLETPAYVKTGLLNRAHMAQIAKCFDELVGTGRTRSEQHTAPAKGKGRQKQDKAHLAALVQFFSQRSPFTTGQGTVIRNIFTKVNGGASVNVHMARAKGEAVIATMPGKQVHGKNTKSCPAQCFVYHSATMRCINNTVLLKTKMNNKVVQYDPNLMFQRLMCLNEASSKKISKEVLFRYECTQMSPALFDELGNMRKANKASLATHVRETYGGSDATTFTRRRCLQPAGAPAHASGTAIDFVIVDVCAYLRRVGWKKGAAFKDIARGFVNTVIKQYGHVGAANIVLVADGHVGTTTKSSCQAGARAQDPCPDQAVDDDTSLHFDREVRCVSAPARWGQH